MLAILFLLSAAEAGPPASSADDAPTPPMLLRDGSQAVECKEDWGRKWCEKNGCYWDTNIKRCSDPIANPPSEVPSFNDSSGKSILIPLSLPSAETS